MYFAGKADLKNGVSSNIGRFKSNIVKRHWAINVISGRKAG